MRNLNIYLKNVEIRDSIRIFFYYPTWGANIDDLITLDRKNKLSSFRVLRYVA